jgi:hypothetical protein
MNDFQLPEHCKIVEALAPATDAAGRTGSYISMKNAIRAWLVVHILQGNAATILLSLSEATNVAGLGAAATTHNVEIWSDLDCAASDAMVHRTAAANYTTDAGVKHKQVIIEIKPETLDAGFDCVAPVTGASNVANLTEAQWYILEAYPQATPPSVIVD